MKKYYIHWNSGYGYNKLAVNAESLDDAMEMAKEQWYQEISEIGGYYAEEIEDENDKK